MNDPLSIKPQVACYNSLCGLLGPSSWRRRWLFSRRRSTIWMTCWKVSKGKSDTWLNRWGTHSCLWSKHIISMSIFVQESLTVCLCVCSSAAPELSHGDPGEGPRHQRSAGESGFLGGRGECCSSSLMFLWHFSGIEEWRVRVKGNRSYSAWRRAMKRKEMQPLCVCWPHSLFFLLICELTPDLLCVQNREMHDQMDYFLGGQRSNSYLSSERNPQIVYR